MRPAPSASTAFHFHLGSGNRSAPPPSAESEEEMPTMTTEYEILAEKYRRLRAAAERVIECANYPAADDEEARVYRSQLRTLERELNGVPQPSAFATMSVS
jgi:hypothetical protein